MVKLACQMSDSNRTTQATAHFRRSDVGIKQIVSKLMPHDEQRRHRLRRPLAPI
jgi:hypothetical protein